MALSRWPMPYPSRFWGHRGIAWGVMRRPAFHTSRQETASGRHGGISHRARSVDEIKMSWWGRDDMSVATNATRAFPAAEARTLMGFFRARRGRFEPFWWMDPTDKTVAEEIISASTPAPR